MNEDRPLFILAGNSSYGNLGCEAILRGTVKILREIFQDPCFICLSHFQSEEQYRTQCIQETDKAVVHFAAHRLAGKKEVIQRFWNPGTWLYVYRHIFNPAALKYQIYSEMLPFLDKAEAVLSIGGDNYSLDYGIPTLFTGLDDIVLERGRPLAIWGASVGPFDKNPDYEEYMSHHLRDVTMIFARESITVDYLNSIGVAENVCHIADPAFLMDPEEPEGIEDIVPIDKEAIGINLSPLMANYVCGGDLKAWVCKAASIIEDVSKKTEMPIYLIPHETRPHSNDSDFMQQVHSLIKNKNSNIILIPRGYNAAETKWIISQMAFFAGARTHATIAALSSGVPTLSFAYSIKARGINQDMFGHLNYCMNPEDLDSRNVSERVISMLEKNAMIRRDLKERAMVARRYAMHAGSELKRIIER